MGEGGSGRGQGGVREGSRRRKTAAIEPKIETVEKYCFYKRKRCPGTRKRGSGGVSRRGQGGVREGSSIVKSHGDPARARQLSKEIKVY